MQNYPELLVDRYIYMGAFPRFERPKVIGYIGLENLKFARNIREEDVHYDLNLLIEQAKRKPDDLDVKLTELLKFLLEHEARLDFPLQNSLDHAQIFCYRGLLTCVACTPYEKREPWKIVVLLHKGNIYLCARDTEVKIHKKQNMTDKEKQFTSWGYKFEQYVLSDTPTTDPDPNVPVDETEEFSLVFKTQLNHHTIVYGAEMDGIRCDNGSLPPPPDKELGPEAIIKYLSDKEFVELKTNRHIEFSKQETSFRLFKCKKWWCQSFLVGIETILCGCRNDDGIVGQLKLYQVKDIAKMCQKFWNPSVCLNFLDNFFTYVKRILARHIRQKYGDKAVKNLQALPLISVLLEWTPGSSVQVNEHYSHCDDPILPEWFLKSYKNKSNGIS